ncbi:hypothetical protein BDF14DRAFT_1766907 [Spinellus fusiger]|nr:hypothetical protein BDF14DRAFT_1766907 [Spinellus fusiger]
MIQSESPLLEYFSGMYTYGQPKIGDAQFSKTFNTQLTRKMFHHTYNNGNEEKRERKKESP